MKRWKYYIKYKTMGTINSIDTNMANSSTEPATILKKISTMLGMKKEETIAVLDKPEGVENSTERLRAKTPEEIELEIALDKEEEKIFNKNQRNSEIDASYLNQEIRDSRI